MALTAATPSSLVPVPVISGRPQPPPMSGRRGGGGEPPLLVAPAACPVRSAPPPRRPPLPTLSSAPGTPREDQEECTQRPNPGRRSWRGLVWEPRPNRRPAGTRSPCTRARHGRLHRADGDAAPDRAGSTAVCIQGKVPGSARVSARPGGRGKNAGRRGRMPSCSLVSSPTGGQRAASCQTKYGSTACAGNNNLLKYSDRHAAGPVRCSEIDQSPAGLCFNQ